MIRIRIETNGKDILDSYEDDKPTLVETAMVIRRLEELKLKFLDMEFESKFEVSEE